MKEFALIFRLNDMADFRPSPEQMQERMNWLGSIAAQNKLAGSNYYHALLGYLYVDTDPDQAISHYRQAITLTKSSTEKQTLTREIKRLKE
jgi:predicted RNA polymerase sigma factor